jgi:serine protease Do
MNRKSVLSITIIAAAMILSACSGINFGLAPAENAPAAQVVPTATEAAAPAASSSASQTKQISVPAQAPIIAGDALSLQTAYENVYTKVNPSVVNIEVASKTTTTRGRSSTSATPVPTGEGSGFVWDISGRIVTNAHVIDGADVITVNFADGTSADAKLVGADVNTDLAVIQVDPAGLKLVPVEVADSTQAKVGQVVVAIGSPFGFEGSMSTGIISALNRSVSAGSSNNSTATAGRYTIPNIIQTDAAINPGNSGGVLADLEGRLVGVTSSIESPVEANSGVGFAIPSSIVKKVVPELISKGGFSRSYLGITGGTLSPDIAAQLNLKADQRGVVITDVVAGGPADKAGLKGAAANAAGGDVITAIDGKTITRFEDLVTYIFNLSPGQTVTLTVLRDGQEMTLKVELGSQPKA